VSEAGTFLDGLVGALDACLSYSEDAEAPAVAILWPDKAAQWTGLARRVAAVRPVLTLGAYSPGDWTGPALWIRCVVDGSLQCPAAAGTPIVYLPGYDRTQIRSVEDAPVELRPLLELQYRGAIFAQLSNRDWTLAAFLQAAPARGGLGIEVASDDVTKTALRAAADVLADELIGDLRRKAPLRAAFFNGLLVPDLDRDVLQWLDDPVAFEKKRTPEAIRAFREAFRERFGLDLVAAGERAVAERLGRRESDSWSLVWRAYEDAPDRYPRVEERLRAAKPKGIRETRPNKQPGFFDVRDAWPQDNEAAEAELRAALSGVAALASDDARTRLIELDQVHGERRGWVWARRGHAPLAFAVQWLAELARRTQKNLPEGDIGRLVTAYTDEGWQADDALLRALAAVEAPADIEVVGGAASAVYRGWLEVGAERLQAAIGPSGADYIVTRLDDWVGGTAVIFTDGLRYDVGRRLASVLEGAGFGVELRTRLTALPTITPTGKPAASPAVGRLVGGPGLGPVSAFGGAPLSAEALRREISSCGYQVLASTEVGDPSGRAWTEQGDIDSLGHDETRLAPLLDSEVHKLELRIAQLLAAGWTQVVVVTDHGWLYLPGGLPKAELPLHLAKDALRKGRAARLEEGVAVDVPTVPWFWDPAVRIAVAPGIRCFVGSPVYEHGGISPQECITPVVIARAAGLAAGPVELSVTWVGLRARITTTGAPSGATVDLRRKAGDASSSLIGGGRALDADGSASFLVEDGDLEGTSSFMLVLDGEGRALVEQTVTIGGDG
jgi:hypothetical protein